MFSAEDPRAIINRMTFIGPFRSKVWRFYNQSTPGRWQQGQIEGKSEPINTLSKDLPSVVRCFSAIKTSSRVGQ